MLLPFPSEDEDSSDLDSKPKSKPLPKVENVEYNNEYARNDKKKDNDELSHKVMGGSHASRKISSSSSDLSSSTVKK